MTGWGCSALGWDDIGDPALVLRAGSQGLSSPRPVGWSLSSAWTSSSKRGAKPVAPTCTEPQQASTEVASGVTTGVACDKLAARADGRGDLGHERAPANG